METITVRKDKLVDTLINNRDEHEAIFDKAQAAYREAVIEALDRALTDAKAGRELRTYISLPVPENHTEDFNTAIDMLNWDTGEEVELDRRDFLRYVKNQWEWRAGFAANTESYLGS